MSIIGFLPILSPLFRALIYPSMQNPSISQIVIITQIVTLTEIVTPFLASQNVTIMSRESILFLYPLCTRPRFLNREAAKRAATVVAFRLQLLFISEEEYLY